MRKKKNVRTTVGFVVMVVLLCFMTSGVLQAQIQLGHESLTRGKLWQTIWNSLQHGNPVDPPSQLYTMDYPGYTTGADWDDHMAHVQSAAYQIYGERGGTAVAYTIGKNILRPEELSPGFTQCAVVAALCAVVIWVSLSQDGT